MKILFICGSMYPGHDGVGDYTRNLAAELVKEGIQVSVLALFEHALNDIVYESQNEGLVSLSVLRLPSNLKMKVRFNHAKDWVNKNNPDFLSLQYVPFAFNSKGISLTINRFLKTLGKGKPWQIMFHELWVGIEKSSGLKFRVWGLLQKYLIKNLINSLNPIVVHTQTQVYQFLLSDLGFKAIYLPIFSNIHVTGNNSDNAVLRKKSNVQLISFVIFGGIHPGAPIIEFANEAALYIKSNNVEFSLSIVGRTGSETQNWVSAWEAVGLPLRVFGEQSSEQISKILKNSSIGISTTPILLVEKSGTVAAMLAHNLPVICVSKPWVLRKHNNFSILPGTFEYKKGNFNMLITEKSFPEQCSLLDISNQFLDSLLKCDS